jgi:hypothetical protein
MGFTKDRTVRRLAGLGLLVALVVLTPLASPGQVADRTPRRGIEITLNRKFIKDFKDRVTIEATYTVDKAHKKPNPPAKDGDLHIAGRAPEIGLPTVAEIMNAKDQKKAVDLIHSVEGKNKPVKITGAWRMWCEHGGTKPQKQGDPLQPFDTTNPDHVFEIHPITKIDKLDLLGSLKPIEGFQTKDAHDAFVNYENLPCEIKLADKEGEKITLITHMGGYNYVEFILELNGDPEKLEDGTAVLAQVRDLQGELLVRDRRMVFVAGSEPEQKVKELKKGNRLHVLGLPRIDLALVNWRVEHADDPRHPLTWNLPYEIIVAAVYPGMPEGDD